MSKLEECKERFKEGMTVMCAISQSKQIVNNSITEISSGSICFYVNKWRYYLYLKCSDQFATIVEDKPKSNEAIEFGKWLLSTKLTIVSVEQAYEIFKAKSLEDK